MERKENKAEKEVVLVYHFTFCLFTILPFVLLFFVLVVLCIHRAEIRISYHGATSTQDNIVKYNME